MKRTGLIRASAAAMTLVGVAVFAAACGGGTSSSDKTATAAAGSGAGQTPVATSAATQPAATAAATAPAASEATQVSGSAGVMVADSSLGKILVDAKGFTLYTFSNDVAGSGKSAGEALAAVWPPLSLDAAPTAVPGATGAWSIFTRADGKTQVAYNGMPLYYFANDKAAGDTNGDKVGGVWFVAVP